MECDFFREMLSFVKSHKPDMQELAREKLRLSNIFKLRKIPSNFDILIQAKESELPKVRPYLITKPTRTLSGVAVVAVMGKPRKCPHGRCVMCPGGPGSNFGDVPQSYTGSEPATRRAIRNHFDPYLQVFNRLEQYVALGHNIEKIELIIMGGTFPSFPIHYQDKFMAQTLKGLNDFSKLFIKNHEIDIVKFREFFELPGDIASPARVSRIQKKILKLKGRAELSKEQARNQVSSIRCVAMCIETRPDHCKAKHIKQMLKLGCTRVELGVQSLDNKILEGIQRGHTVEDTVAATKLLRDAFLKVGYHIMPGLPGSSAEKDVETFKHLFSDERFRPDFLKIYPCIVVEGTQLFKDWQNGSFKPLSVSSAADIIRQGKHFIPEYTRIMRVQRDIPCQLIRAGPNMTNLRQLLKGVACRCIRCREFGTHFKSGIEVDTKRKSFRVSSYNAAGGVEHFIQCEDKLSDTLLGFCRLRLCHGRAGIRELHVYGAPAEIAKRGDVQHTGIGKRLMAIAEQLARNAGEKKIYVISGIGVRQYYRELGYNLRGPYMVK